MIRGQTRTFKHILVPIDPARRNRGWGTTSYKVGVFCQCPILFVK